MNKRLVLSAIITFAVATFVYAGSCSCDKKGDKAGKCQVKTQDEGKAEAVKSVALCGSCGEIKGSKGCCDKTAKRCKCGAIKGAPGCCKLPEKGKDAILCSDCGEIKGSEGCCDKKAKRCKCGAIKGAPGCCKLPAKVKSCGGCPVSGAGAEEEKKVKAKVKSGGCCPVKM